MQSRSRGRSITLIVVGVIVIIGSILALIAGGQILWWLGLAAGVVALVVGAIDIAKNRNHGAGPLT